MTRAGPDWPIKSGPVTDAERDQIVTLAAGGRKRTQIARELERHPSTIYYYVIQAGLAPPRARHLPSTIIRDGRPVYPFCVEESEHIEDLATGGMGATDIATAVWEKFGRHRTLGTIINHLNRLAAAREAGCRIGGDDGYDADEPADAEDLLHMTTGTTMSLPYENATSGRAATDDMRKLLTGFGASSFGVMEDFAAGLVTVQFEWRGRRVTVSASTTGYAAAWLKRHPFNPSRHPTRHGTSREQYELKAARQAGISVYSILRDWIKGQVTAIEVGMLSFEAAFLGQLVLGDGRTVLEIIERTGVVELPGRSGAEGSGA